MKAPCGALAAAVLLISGCRPSPPQKTAPPPPEYFQVDTATAAAISGKVTFRGKAPAPKKINMDAEEDCQKLHEKPVFDEPVQVSPKGELANVFVYVKSGLEGKTFVPPATAVELDQHGCQFVPRIVALRAGQTLAVKNSDPVSHNIHPMPKLNRDWNQQQPPESPDLQRRFARPEVMIPVKCNIHAWMKTYIAVLDHPYFTVTDSDGKFTLPNLPPGKYTVAAWHEQFGESVSDVTVEPAKPVPLNFTFR